MACDCVNNGTKNICAHALAVEEHSLKELVGWYNETNQDVSLWNLVRSSGIPKHPGDKNNSRKRKQSCKVIPSPYSSSSLLPACSKSHPIVKKNSTHILPSVSSDQLHDTLNTAVSDHIRQSSMSLLNSSSTDAVLPTLSQPNTFLSPCSSLPYDTSYW